MDITQTFYPAHAEGYLSEATGAYTHAAGWASIQRMMWIFDDGQEHRWEYKADGTYVYYEKDGDTWVPGDDTENEYFVAGNLLCTRWVENDEEYREWWEITIDAGKMNWTALREDEDGNTFTATFEMNRIEED